MADQTQHGHNEERSSHSEGPPTVSKSYSDAKAGAGPGPGLIEMCLLGTFAVWVEHHALVTLPEGSQRLLVYLALRERSVARVAVAGTLWPDVSDQLAGVSLRSALSRLDGLGHDAVVLTTAGAQLAQHVSVDLHRARALARRLLQPGSSTTDADLSGAAVAMLSLELLPDWYDDWVVAEAEDWRQLRANALEAQARLLTASGRLAEAAGAARAAIRVEPLRESAHASLIRVHLAEGNQSEALRAFNLYRALLRRELGLEPTAHLSELVASIQR